MLRNYFKIAGRNLVRNLSFSAINISGLALGLAAAMLIFLWVQDELSIGRQHKNADHLYRIMEREFTDGKVVTDENTPGIIADELKRVFPEVVYAAGFSSSESHMLTVGNKSLRQSGNFAGADWFNLYNIPLLVGTPAALRDPGSVAISRKLAETYFGQVQNALGKSIRFDNHIDRQVTAVFEDHPANATDQYDFLLNWQEFLDREPWLKKWTNYGPATRLMLSPAADVAALDSKLTWFLKGRNDEFSKSFYINLFLKAEKDAYLYSNYKNGYLDGGRIEYVRLLSIIAVFLVLIAGINFMNLATARSVKRSMEVGVRKVVGAGRASLITQFLSEAFLLVIIAIVLGLTLVSVSLTAFNSLTGKLLHIPFDQPDFWLYLIGLLVLTGLFAGSYPAFFLSAFNPMKVLKGAVSPRSGDLVFRRGLVVFQFMLSLILIVGTVVIYQQLQYFQNKNLGYDRENLINIPLDGDLPKNYQVFKEELLRMSGIQSATHMYASPLGNGNTTESVSWTGKNPDASISFNNTAVGFDFVKTMKVKVTEGRDFSADFGNDSTNYLINQAAAKRIGYKDPVGQPLTFWSKPGKIIGVVEDFHFSSLHQAINPLIIRLADGHYGNMLIRTQPGQTKEALASIESVYKKFNPKFPFTYAFVDAGYETLYRSENIVGTMAAIFAFLAIFIACLGLFGLAAFTAEQRTKEIGVRKVMGASVAGIVALLSGDFLKLVLIGVVISSPVAWYVMNQWLDNFAYKIDIQWWVFVLAGLLAICIAMITISYQSIRAAMMNPVKSLRGND